MGLRADIFRGNYDAEINELYGKAEVTLVNVEGPFEPTEDAPPVMLVPGNVPYSAKVVPAVMDQPGEWSPLNPCEKVGPMMGGTYVATSDSRFGDAVRALVGGASVGAVPLHDRFETTAQYAALST
jgi:hypothetical protein